MAISDLSFRPLDETESITGIDSTQLRDSGEGIEFPPRIPLTRADTDPSIMTLSHKRWESPPDNSEHASPGQNVKHGVDRQCISTNDASEDTPLLNSRSGTDRRSEYARHKNRSDIEGQSDFANKPNTFQQLLFSCKLRALSAARTAFNPKRWSTKAVWHAGVQLPISLLPCVFLGVLLNVLDALSYGKLDNLFSTRCCR